METVIRAILIYLFLFIILRIAGKRTFAEITTLDFILILIISETTQQAMVGDDFSITNAAIAITSLIGIDIAFNYIKTKSRFAELWIDGTPIILVNKGKLLKERIRKSGVAEEDILESAREKQGLQRMDEIKYAILEKSGGITIIPNK